MLPLQNDGAYLYYFERETIEYEIIDHTKN